MSNQSINVEKLEESAKGNTIACKSQKQRPMQICFTSRQNVLIKITSLLFVLLCIVHFSLLIH